LVGVALTTDGPVGIDIEPLERRIEPLGPAARHAFTDAELQWLATFEPGQMGERFLSLWTLKESYVKARGTGLFIDPTSFSFRPDEDPPAFNPPPDDTRAWDFYLLTGRPTHVTAVCSPSPRKTLFLHDGAELLFNNPLLKRRAAV
jgi:4'-phosphopantetheinyl transferase